MAIIQKNGKSLFFHFLKKASTAFGLGDAVSFDASGLLIPATSSSSAIAGYIRRAVVSTDEDYASQSYVGVELFTDNSVYEIDASTTVTQAMVGTLRDLTDAGTLNVSTGATVGQFRVLGIGQTSTKAIVTCPINSVSNN